MNGTNSCRGGSWALSCLLILLSVVGYSNGVTDLVVLPMSQFVPLGSESDNFTCSHTCCDHATIYWNINGKNVYQGRTNTSDILMRQGFSFYWMTVPAHVIKMSVNATIDNNGTEIKCKLQGHLSHTSKAARLIVIGAPLPPEPQLKALNATWILVSWKTPFTWHNYEILQYNVTMKNANTSTEVVRLVNATDTNVTFEGMVAQNCTEFIFTVSAFNGLGWSDPGIITGGFPIPLDRHFESFIKVEVHFKPDGIPRANITFELPHMCSYQRLEYTISIRNLTSNYCFEVGPKEYSYSKGSSVSELLESQLLRNTFYSIISVTIHTPAGNSTLNTSTIFNTTLNTADPTSTDDTIKGRSRTLIIAVAVGSAVAVILLVTASIAIAKALVRIHEQERDDQKQSVQVVQSAMVSNPIYEGPMYETIVPQNFDSLAANVESESEHIPESRYLDNPIFPARISSEADTRIIPVTDDVSLTPAPGDDNYTVMSPIGSHIKFDEQD